MPQVSRLYPASPYPPRPGDPPREPWRARGWPCHWVGCADAGEPPFVAGYRCRFRADDAGTTVLRAHVSADERYELLLDGARIGRGGGERGNPRHWGYETYAITLEPGEHLLTARVWALGPLAPLAQMRVRPGFLFSPQDDGWIARLGTGVAGWEAQRLEGYAFLAPPATMTGVGACFAVDGDRFPWGWEDGAGEEGWGPAVKLDAAADAIGASAGVPLHRLEPATLPPMREEPWTRGVVRFVARAEPGTNPWPIETREPQNFQPALIQLSTHLGDEAGGWQRLLSGRGALILPAGTARRVIVDLEDYCCAYPRLTLSGGRGGLVRVRWAEAVYEDEGLQRKGPRDELDGRFYAGAADFFRPDGGTGRCFETLWWRCGRYVEIVAGAAGEPLVIEGFELLETRYPLEMVNGFAASDPRLAALTPVLLRGLQMCAHETYVDCPYYEQLQYVGDAALQALTGAQITRDDRLWRRFLRLVDASRPARGFTESRYPSQEAQGIPTFSLCWIGSLHDYARWRDDPAFVRDLLPGARALLDQWLNGRNADGLILSPNGWNFVDWTPGPPFWYWGVPPGGEPDGMSAVVNLHVVWTLRRLAEMEEWLGEGELAARWRRLAAELSSRVVSAFWDEASGRFADDAGHTQFSDHAQCLAILGGALDPARLARAGTALLTAPGGTMRTSVYFAHYWFEACRALGRMDAALARMEQWFELNAMGFRTTPEVSDLLTTRSDCHAWSATPLFHFFASVLGVRPGAFGYGSVEIAPQLDSLTWARGTAIHPRGEIEVDLRRENDGSLLVRAVLPENLDGWLIHGAQRFALRAGEQEIRCV